LCSEALRGCDDYEPEDIDQLFELAARMQGRSAKDGWPRPEIVEAMGKLLAAGPVNPDSVETAQLIADETGLATGRAERRAARYKALGGKPSLGRPRK
jgi:hypothetical protein